MYCYKQLERGISLPLPSWISLHGWSFSNSDSNNKKNGEIADVIPTPDRPMIRYGYERASPNSRRLKQEGSVCCRSCENNHAIIVRQLSQYLPDESDPNYEYLAEHISDFRHQLEEKYPPLCADCAPKVNARLRQINYKAKTQGLGRLLDNTNKMVQSNRLAQPKSLGVVVLDFLMVLGWYAWGAAYWGCIALLMFWQLNISIVAMPSGSLQGLEAMGWDMCLKGSFESGYLNNACYVVSSRWVSYLFPWALVLSFYDYKWLEVRRHPGSYVEDRLPYMVCQGVVAAFIGLSWWFLGPGGILKKEKEIIVLSNSCLLIEFFMLWTAFTSLRVTHPVQKISLKESKPLLPSALISSQSSFQETSGSMNFRPTGPSIQDHLPQQKPTRSSNRTGHQYKIPMPTQTGPKPQIEPPQSSPPFQSQYSINNQQSFNSGSAPSYNPFHIPTQTTSQSSDPDAMDWNPSTNGLDTQHSFNPFASFSQHRPSSPLEYLASQGRGDGNSSDEEDRKTEVNDSPMKPFTMRPKSLLIDGMLGKQTGLESLFEVAAKLDGAKPIKQPGILAKRAHRIGQEAARLLAVCIGLVVLVSSEGMIACVGLFLAVIVGTCWRFVNAAFRTESRILSIGEMWKRNLAILVCLLEICGSLLVSAEMLGLNVISKPPNTATVNMPVAPSLLSNPMTPTDTALPIFPNGAVDLAATLQSAPFNGQTQLTQLIIRILFFSLAAHQTWDFAQVFAYKGTPVVQEEEYDDDNPVRERRGSRDLGVSNPVRSFVPHPNRVPSPLNHNKVSPPKPASTGFGGLSLGGSSSGSLTRRSNFSSWGKQDPDVGIKRPQTERFGATTTRSMKLPPAGVSTASNPWNAQPGFSSQSSFQQPRDSGTWGS
ncbi:hypothetical protein ABW20_dc0108439 [Dactylellina cionopaga]|nr:hypothetical protein ABW20_dc0108439 [Dactylellina cionopaga]